MLQGKRRERFLLFALQYYQPVAVSIAAMSQFVAFNSPSVEAVVGTSLALLYAISGFALNWTVGLQQCQTHNLGLQLLSEFTSHTCTNMGFTVWNMDDTS